MSNSPLNMDELQKLVQNLGGNTVARKIANGEILPMVFKPEPVIEVSRNLKTLKVNIVPTTGSEEEHGTIICGDKRLVLGGTEWKMLYYLYIAPNHRLRSAEINKILKYPGNGDKVGVAFRSTLQRLRKKIYNEFQINNLVISIRLFGYQVNPAHLHREGV